MYYVYALRSLKDGNLYIGFSHDVDKRLDEHNSKRVRSTQSRVPFELLYKKSVKTRIEARKKEKQLKSGSGREFLKSLMIRSSSAPT